MLLSIISDLVPCFEFALVLCINENDFPFSSFPVTSVCRPAEFRAGCFATRLLRAKGCYGLFKYNGISDAPRQSTVYRDGASVTIGAANPHWALHIGILSLR